MGGLVERSIVLAMTALAIACGEEPARPAPAAAPERAATESVAHSGPTAAASNDEPSAPSSSEAEAAPAVDEPGAQPPSVVPVGDPAASAAVEDPSVPAEQVDDDPSAEEDDAEEPIVPPGPDGRLARGPARETAEEAAVAALTEDYGEAIEATVAYRRFTYVLFTMPGQGPAYAPFSRSGAPPRVALYLARVRGPSADGTYVREDGARLYEHALSSDENRCDEATIANTSELRARDVDGDGEVEITVIAAVAATSPAHDSEVECGAVAFLVGGDDLGVQARFTREYHYEKNDAGGETYLDMETAWRLTDVNGDGRADLHVTESYRYRDDFSGDWAGDDYGTVPGNHERASNRRSVDCLYDAATDTWPCPDPAPGLQLLRTRDELLRPDPRRAIRPAW